MLPSLDEVIKFGPIVCGLLAFFALFLVNTRKNKEHDLMDLFVVGAAGSSTPTGCLLIYGAFDGEVLKNLTDANVYIAFAGAALIFIFYKTFKEKI